MEYLFLFFILFIVYIIFLHLLFNRAAKITLSYQLELLKSSDCNYEICNNIMRQIKFYLPRQKDIVNNYLGLSNNYKNEKSFIEKAILMNQMNYIIKYLIGISKVYISFEKHEELKIDFDNYIISKERFDFSKEFFNNAVEDYNSLLTRIYFFPYKILFKPKEIKGIL